MTRVRIRGRTVGLIAFTIGLLAVFVFVALRSGPLAPVPVTIGSVDSGAVTPALFGIGTIQSRFSYRIGPTAPGRVQRLLVDVGDAVTAGQLLGEIDPVDLDDRIRAQEALVGRNRAALAEARARQQYARVEGERYEQLFAARSTSEEVVAALASVDAASQAADTSAERQHAYGAVGYLQVLVAWKQSRQAQSNVIAARAQRLFDSVQYDRAAGGTAGPVPTTPVIGKERECDANRWANRAKVVRRWP